MLEKKEGREEWGGRKGRSFEERTTDKVAGGIDLEYDLCEAPGEPRHHIFLPERLLCLIPSGSYQAKEYESFLQRQLYTVGRVLLSFSRG